MSKNQKTPTPESQLKDADFAKTSQYDKTYRQIKTLNDPRFGDIHILQNPQTRQVVAVREKKVTDRAEAGRQIIAARNRLALKNPYLVNLLDYSVIKQSELCSSFYIIKYYFEYPRTDLRKYYLDKEKSGQGLTAAELTHILYQQNQALAYLQSQGTAHGDLQPLYVGWDPEKNESRLIDKSETLTNDAAIIQAQKNRLISGQPLYLSPTMYSNLKKGNTKFQFDRNKEDAFALGLLVLEAGNGHSIQNIYDAKAGQINQGALNQHLDEFNRKFGAQNTLLVSHVSSLVNTNEAARPSPVQVQSSLPPYEEVRARLANSEAIHQGTANYAGGSNYTSTTGFAPGIEQSTRSLVHGGDLKTTITTVKDMPEVREDLFAFEQVNAPPHAQANWDPSLVVPAKVEVPSARYNFIPDPNRPAPQAPAPPQTYSAPNQHSLFDEAPASNNLFTTFGSTHPGDYKNKGQQNTMVVGDHNNPQWQTESIVSNQYSEFNQPSNFQRKVQGENVTGQDAAPQQYNQNDNYQSHVAQPANTHYSQSHVAQPAVATTQTSYHNVPINNTGVSYTHAPITTTYTTGNNILPTTFRRSVSTASQPSIQHEFRLYDSTLTQPEVRSGGSYVTPLNTTQTTASYTYAAPARPLSQRSYSRKSVTYVNATPYEAPRSSFRKSVTYVNSTPNEITPLRSSVYYAAAPTTTYTTSAPSYIPTTYTTTNPTYTTTAPSYIPTTYTTTNPTYTTSPTKYSTNQTFTSYSQSHIAAPQRVSYITSAPTTYTSYSQSNVATPQTVTYQESVPSATITPASPTVTYTSQSHIAAPQNVTYTEAAPVTTYTTYSPNQYTNAPSTVTYLENAPKTYTTYSQSHVAAPQTISYHTNGIGSSNQVIYSNPTVGENPVTTIYNADGTTRRVSRSRVTSSQVITTNSLGSTTDFNGLKLVGTYYDDNNTTTRNL